MWDECLDVVKVSPLEIWHSNVPYVLKEGVVEITILSKVWLKEMMKHFRDFESGPKQFNLWWV
jgi:hypothetical protein